VRSRDPFSKAVHGITMQQCVGIDTLPLPAASCPQRSLHCELCNPVQSQKAVRSPHTGLVLFSLCVIFISVGLSCLPTFQLVYNSCHMLGCSMFRPHQWECVVKFSVRGRGVRFKLSHSFPPLRNVIAFLFAQVSLRPIIVNAD